MRFEFATRGMMVSLGIPAIAPASGGGVNLDWWINVTHNSPRLREILHEGDRPTAEFITRAGRKLEVYYQFGYIIPIPRDEGDKVGMQELLDHLNEL